MGFLYHNPQNLNEAYHLLIAQVCEDCGHKDFNSGLILLSVHLNRNELIMKTWQINKI